MPADGQWDLRSKNMLGLCLDAQSSMAMLPGGNRDKVHTFFECKFPPCSKVKVLSSCSVEWGKTRTMCWAWQLAQVPPGDSGNELSKELCSLNRKLSQAMDKSRVPPEAVTGWL